MIDTIRDRALLLALRTLCQSPFDASSRLRDVRFKLAEKLCENNATLSLDSCGQTHYLRIEMNTLTVYIFPDGTMNVDKRGYMTRAVSSMWSVVWSACHAPEIER